MISNHVSRILRMLPLENFRCGFCGNTVKRIEMNTVFKRCPDCMRKLIAIKEAYSD